MSVVDVGKLCSATEWFHYQVPGLVASGRGALCRVAVGGTPDYA